MAAAFFMLLYFGRTWLNEGKIAEYAVLAGFACLAYWAYVFIGSFSHADRVAAERPFQPVMFMQTLILKPLVLFPLVGPAAVFASAIMQYVFADRFVPVLLLSVICVVLHWRIGPGFLQFSRDRMLAGYLVDPNTNAQLASMKLRPDLLPLCIALGIALVVPTFSSVTFGIVILVACLSAYLARRFRALCDYGAWRAVVGRLEARSQFTVYDYFDYLAHEDDHWRPPSERFRRRASLLALVLPFDLALLIALSCFFPWELCASFAVPGYNFPFSAFTHYPAADFRWLLTPIELGGEAKPPLLYFSGILIGVPLFILVPPAVLLAAYFQPFVELENMHQKLKRTSN
jgi:hypothetical protein